MPVFDFPVAFEHFQPQYFVWEVELIGGFWCLKRWVCWKSEKKNVKGTQGVMTYPWLVTGIFVAKHSFACLHCALHQNMYKWPSTWPCISNRFTSLLQWALSAHYVLPLWPILTGHPWAISTYCSCTEHWLITVVTITNWKSVNITPKISTDNYCEQCPQFKYGSLSWPIK